MAAPIQSPAKCEVVSDQSWPTAPLFVVNISPSFGENSRHHFVTFCRFITLP